MSIDELGNGNEAEAILRLALHLSERWGAIFSLDLNNLDSGHVASVVSRLLGDYRGIVFLLANQVSQVNPTFAPRINDTLGFNQLS
ncbi:hypothetical protein FVEN_g12778 [Fusarium venenatum]|nr:hypothetical protein FVEN_g12778 [Fusarium venenatum]